MRILYTLCVFLAVGSIYAAEKQTIGRVSFRFYDKDETGHIQAQPLIPPQLKITYLRGEKTVPTDIMTCDVLAEKVSETMLPTGETLGMMTVLKCGATYYAVTEIDFVVNK